MVKFTWGMMWQEHVNKKKSPKDIIQEGLKYFLQKHKMNPSVVLVSQRDYTTIDGLNILVSDTIPSGHYVFAVVDTE